ncbi:MAG: tripartite tricarboxylate transporter TctB family protein, partial [Spirochaetia bacterium]|nr:tripartite tricarboxylate transporter TctB family protein [Spirochaetia bacterium]
MPKITYKLSTSHWIFPPIIMGILVFLAIIMLLGRAYTCKKQNKPFFHFKDYHFLEQNWDKVRLPGTLLLLVLYFPAMNLIGFLPASIIFIFLLNVLFVGLNQLASIPVA